MVDGLAARQAQSDRGNAENAFGGPARGTQFPDAGVAIRLREFLSVLARDQGVMEESRREGAAEKTRHLDLTARRRQQILATDHEVDPLIMIVNDHRELVRPATIPVSQQHITALFCGGLLDVAETQIAKGDGLGFDAQPPRTLGPAI